MRKQLFFVTLMAMQSMSLNAGNAPRPLTDYIDRYADLAVTEMKLSGIPASIILAQGIKESRWGLSDLTRNTNNHFGIKCKSNWTGDCFNQIDDDRDENGNLIESGFRVYSSTEESYRDHTLFLKNNTRYEALFQNSPTDYKNWAKGLSESGYATNPNYSDELVDLIETYHLYEYDLPMERSELLRNLDGSQTSNTSEESAEADVDGTRYLDDIIPPAEQLPEDYNPFEKPATTEPARQTHFTEEGVEYLFEITPEKLGNLSKKTKTFEVVNAQDDGALILQPANEGVIFSSEDASGN